MLLPLLQNKPEMIGSSRAEVDRAGPGLYVLPGALWCQGFFGDSKH